MLLELAVIFLGILVSFFLKDMNLLSLHFEAAGVIFPDFLLLFLIYFALFKDEFHGTWIGFISGLLEDSAILTFSEASNEFVPILGSHALIYTLVGFTLGKMNRIIDKESMLPVVVVVFSTTFLVRLLVWLLVGLLGQAPRAYSFLGPAFYTAILAPVYFFAMSWVYKHREA